MDYVKWVNKNKSRQKPILSEFQKYTMSKMVNQLEDYTTFSLALSIVSKPEPFIQFLNEVCGYDVEDKEISVVWPQCPINTNSRLDLLIGFSMPHDKSEVVSCLIIESKIEDELTDKQLKKYLGEFHNCNYLALTKYPEKRVNVTNWDMKTWQEIVDFEGMKNLDNGLWAEIFQSMAYQRIIVDLRAEPKMDIDDFPKLTATVNSVMGKVFEHYYSENIRNKLKHLGFFYYDPKGDPNPPHWNHMLNDQFLRCNRFTIACEDRKLKRYKSWFLFGLFRWKNDEDDTMEWHAGAVIERKPEENPDEFKKELQDLQDEGTISEEWVLFDSDDSKGTDFGEHLVAMKSRPLDEFDECTNAIQYINDIISEMKDEPFASICKDIIYS